MKYLIYQTKLFVTLLVAIFLFYNFSFSVAKPIFAPTMEVNVLGEIDKAQVESANFVSYQIPAEAYNSKVKAAGYGAYNLASGDIITKDHTDIPLPVASLTKLMTAWVVLKFGSLDDTYIINSKDIESTKPALNLKIGDEVLVKDLLFAMLIGSNNDSATSLSGYIEQKTKSKFTDLMNDQAIQLGMVSSRYSNPIGFDSSTNYSSVDDTYKLVQKLLDTNVFENTSRRTSYLFESVNKVSYQSIATNKLIAKYPDLYAVKTGYTNTALGSMVNILEYNNEKYLLIVIGSPDRETDTLELRNLVINQ